MAKLKSGTRIYGTATIDTSVVVGSAVTLSSSGIQVSGIVTATSYRGDGSLLTGISASGGISISTNTTNQAQFITYAISTGSTTGLGVSTTKLVFNPSSGNLGIGTTNPQYIFTVTDTGTPATVGLTNCLADFTTTTNSYGQINLRNTSTGTNASSDVIVTADTGNDSTNFIDLGINNSGFSVGSWTINGPTDGYLYTSDTNLSIGAASASKYVSIFAGGTLAANEKLRVNNTGVGIGTTNPLATLQVGTAITMYGSTGIISAVSYRGDGSQLTGVSGGVTVTDDTTTNAVRYVLFDDATSGTVSGINVSSTKLRFNPFSGTLSATVFTSLSDQTKKTNVRSVTNAIELVNKMRGVYYDWIDNHNTGSVGVIAQEIEKVLPEVVDTNNDGLKTVSYGNIVGVLIEAIKEQQIRIEELEKKINA